MKYLNEGAQAGCLKNDISNFNTLSNIIIVPCPLNCSLPVEYRFSGTIVGVEDNKSSVWANSEWRSLKVSIRDFRCASRVFCYNL